MPLKKLLVLVCSSFISWMALAQNITPKADTDKLIDTFLKCDDQFFHQLAESKTSFEQFFDIATSDNIAYIPVKNVQKNDENSIIFKKPINYHGLTITGYQNIYIETPFSGQYYFWGFILNNDLNEVKTTLNKLNWLQYTPEAYIANAKIYDRRVKSPTWNDNPYSIDGVMPRQGTIEKSLYLESVPNNKVHLVCSLQGDINNDILYVDRPDMKPVNEQIIAKQQEKIKAYKLKKQKEKEQLEKETLPSSNSNNTTENNSK